MGGLKNGIGAGKGRTAVRRSPARAALICSTAMFAVFAANQAQAGCDGAVVVTTPIGVYNATPLGVSGAASVNSIVSVIATTNTAFLTQSSAFVGAPSNPQADQPGGGVWSRGIGGEVETKNTGVNNNFTLNGGPPANLSVNCQTTTRTTFSGYQTGADIAKLNFAGSGTNIHFGVTTGYMEANSRDVNTTGVVPGGTFSMKTQVPFAGLYAVLTQGRFFADAQLRWDYLQNSASDPAANLNGQRFDARSTSFTANAGYQFALSNNWFVEPSLGVVYSRTDVDTLSVAGDGTLANVPGSVQVGAIESALGRASVRVGTNFTSGGIGWQPFVTGSVFHEFADNVKSTLTTCVDPLFGAATCGALGGAAAPVVQSQLSTSRIGTYGQVAVGVAGQLLNTGWLGYGRVDYRFGENVEGVSVNAGLRYQFTPGAMAAKASGGIYKAPVKAVVAEGPYNWTGFYVGAHAGTMNGFTDWTFVGGQTVDPKVGGALAGGQAGFNYQMGTLVLGLEGDGSWTNAHGSSACPNGFYFTCHSQVESVFSATGRIGVALNRVLVYGKAGAAWGDVGLFSTDNQTGLTFRNGSETRVGWVGGLGFEFGLTPNWSAKAEYNYVAFESRDLTTTLAGGGTEPVRFGLDLHLAKVGVNYRFGSAPLAVSASY